MDEGFYRAFEDRYRGSREQIGARLLAYLPFLEPLVRQWPQAQALDLGCGRGEWLELLQQQGFAAQGVDMDAGMLQACTERGLQVRQGDALAYLDDMPDSSLAVVSAFHLVEHISFESLARLVRQALRVLRPGGLMILETPNPDNLLVAARDFYMDPSHHHPIPSQLLAFVAEYAGFERVRVVPLQESAELRGRQNLALHEVLGGASPDYAVVAQKAAAGAAPQLDDAFAAEWGLRLMDLAGRYDAQWHREHALLHRHVQRLDEDLAHRPDQRQMQALDQQVQALAQQLAGQVQGLEQRLQHQQAELLGVYASRSWRVTAPLRWAGMQYRRLREQGGRERVRRALIKLARPVLRRGVGFMQARPAFKARVLRLLTVLGLGPRLQALYQRWRVAEARQRDAQSSSDVDQMALTPRARQMYARMQQLAGYRQKDGE